MGRIICITGDFPVVGNRGEHTGRTEFVVSHGIDEDTYRHVVLPCEPPQRLGAVFDDELREWVLAAPEPQNDIGSLDAPKPSTRAMRRP